MRRRVYVITEKFPRKEHREVLQMNGAARPSKQNIQEGHFQTAKGFVRYLMVSQGSVSELGGGVEDCLDNGLITKEDRERRVG